MKSLIRVIALFVFFIISLPLQALTLDVPTGETVDISNPSSPVFKWNAVNNATTYRIIISKDSTFSGFTENLTSSTCNSTCLTVKVFSSLYAPLPNEFTPQQNVTYYWKVRAGSDTVGYEHSSWSPTFSFKTQPPVSLCPSSVIPNPVPQTWQQWLSFFSQIASGNIACVGGDFRPRIVLPQSEKAVSFTKLKFLWTEPNFAGVKPSKYRLVVSKNTGFTGYSETTKKCDGTCFTMEVSSNTLSLVFNKNTQSKQTKTPNQRVARTSQQSAMSSELQSFLNSSPADAFIVKTQGSIPIIVNSSPKEVVTPWSEQKPFYYNILEDTNACIAGICTKPTLNSPKKNDLVYSQSVPFSWTIGTLYGYYPDNYRIVVSINKDATHGLSYNKSTKEWVCDSSCVTQTSSNNETNVDISTLPKQEKYYWCVRANYAPNNKSINGVTTNWSDIFVFKTLVNPPTKQQLREIIKATTTGLPDNIVDYLVNNNISDIPTNFRNFSDWISIYGSDAQTAYIFSVKTEIQKKSEFIATIETLWVAEGAAKTFSLASAQKVNLDMTPYEYSVLQSITAYERGEQGYVSLKYQNIGTNFSLAGGYLDAAITYVNQAAGSTLTTIYNDAKQYYGDKYPYVAVLLSTTVKNIANSEFGQDTVAAKNFAKDLLSVLANTASKPANEILDAVGERLDWGYESYPVLARNVNATLKIGNFVSNFIPASKFKLLKAAEFSAELAKAGKGLPNWRNYLTASIVKTNSTVISSKGTWMESRVKDIVDGDKDGTKTESLMADLFKDKGYNSYSGKYSGNQEFDGIYIRGDLANPTEVIIMETKQMNGYGIKLNPANSTSGLPAQMSSQWIADTITKLKSTNPQLADILEKSQENGLIKPYVSAVDKSTGNINILQLGNY